MARKPKYQWQQGKPKLPPPQSVFYFCYPCRRMYLEGGPCQWCGQPTTPREHLPNGRWIPIVNIPHVALATSADGRMEIRA